MTSSRPKRAQGPIPGGAILLLRTGFSRRWPDAARYLGTAQRGADAVKQLHFPGLHPDAARWLVANRQVKAVGIDTASIDYGQSTLYESHRVLYERNVPAFENLTNLDRLPRARRVRRGAADEDRRRKRRAAARRGYRAGALSRSPVYIYGQQSWQCGTAVPLGGLQVRLGDHR